MVFDLENCRDRIVRLTVNSSHLGDAVLTPKGDKLYYQAAFEGGYDLWEHDLKENKTKIVMKSVGGGAMYPDKKVKMYSYAQAEASKSQRKYRRA